MTRYEQIITVTDKVFIFDDGYYMGLTSDVQTITQSVKPIQYPQITQTGYSSIFYTFDGAESTIDYLL